MRKGAVGAAAGVLVASAAFADADAQQLRVTELWATAGADADPFVSITGMAEDAGGWIWIADSRGSRITALNAQGDSARVVAREGDGPGEVDSPGMIAGTIKGGLAVYDLGRGSIDLFSPEGEFGRRVILPVRVAWPKGFAIVGDGDFVISGAIPGNAHSIHRFSEDDGRLLSSWDHLRPTRQFRASWIVSGGALSRLAHDKLLFSRSAPHEIVLFTMQDVPGDPTSRLITSDPDLLQPIDDAAIVEVKDSETGRAHRRFRGMFPQSRGIFQLPDGNLLNVITVAEQGQSIWQVYQTSGRLIRQVRVARAYRPWSITRNGDILASYTHPDTGEHIAARIRLAD